MTNLIQRLSEAEEGSRKLDKEVAKHCGGSLRFTTAGAGYEDYRYQVLWPWDEIPSQGSDINQLPDLPRLTTSIDAALALVERVLPGAEWVIDSVYRGSAKWNEQFKVQLPANGDTQYAFSATAPLAICIALLKAVEAGK